MPSVGDVGSCSLRTDFIQHVAMGNTRLDEGLKQEGQCVYVQRNSEARSCNHSCSGKAIIVTYSECVFVALGI
jgi:hypothetical protein